MYFDTHTHVNFVAFKYDAEETVKRALEEEVWMINVGTQLDTSKHAVAIANKHGQGVYAAIGLHPIHTYQQTVDEEESHFKTREETFEAEAYEQLLNEKVVAVGECGLDYFRLPENDKQDVIDKQKVALEAQLDFAQKNGLPVIIHCRDAYDDLLAILTNHPGVEGVIHSFTDTWQSAKKFLDIGFYVALNGILTFDKTGKLAEVARNIPFDRILTETDAPYLTPPPFRGKRNEPLYVKYVAEKIAGIRNLEVEEVGMQTFNNACALFKVQGPASVSSPTPHQRSR